MDGQNVDGQNVDGQNVDGQNVDGQNVDGQIQFNTGTIMRLTTLLFLPFLACSQTSAPQAQVPEPVATPSTEPAQPDLSTKVAQLDGRKPLPLLPHMAVHQREQMRGHLEAIQALNAGLAVNDWVAVEAAAMKLGTSSEMAQTCEHMGAAAPGFTDQALDFHRRADAITVAAKAKDLSGVLRATSDTLTACTACHAMWRQEVVEHLPTEAHGADPTSHAGHHGQ